MVLPTGIASTGWPDVRDKCIEWGDSFDEWQDGAGRAILAKRANGLYAATVGGVTLSIPRQVAKTFLVGRMVFALCVLFPGTTVLWTAHHTRTTTRTFQTLQGLARRKKVKPYLAPDRSGGIRTANGEQEIHFRNGSTILFGAREHGFGRGFEQVDIEVFDEAQKLTERALEDMIAATNQAQHPHGALLFYMGTPPRPLDAGESFTLRRDKALSGESTEAVYLEFSADEGTDPDDREQWAKANPSFPHRTPVESMLRLRENLPSDDAWLREALGIWDTTQGVGVISPSAWQDQEDGDSRAVDRFALGVEVGPDLVCASVALAGQREDDDWHVELDDDQHTRGRGVAWLVPHVQNRLDNNPQIRAVAADVGGPIAALLEKRKGRWFFRGTKIEVMPIQPIGALGAACSRALDGVVVGWLWHIGQPQLTAPALAAGKRELADTGMWVWSRKLAESDITQIQAVTWALHGAQLAKPRKPCSSNRSRSGSNREAVVL